MTRAWPVLLLLLCGASLMVTGARLSYFRAETEESVVVLSWQTDVEDGVREYELLRQSLSSNDAFVSVKTIRAHGTAKPYSYRDDQVYKTADELISYRLDVVYENGLRETLYTQSINYTSTAVRRTWGSIKAMFQ